jgi:hypothetical protein
MQADGAHRATSVTYKNEPAATLLLVGAILQSRPRAQSRCRGD